MAAYTVSVGGKEYDVDAPDEGTAWKWAKATHLKSVSAPTQDAAPKPRQSAADQIANDPITKGAQKVLNTTGAELAMGSAPGRFVQGMGDLGTGALQFAANVNPAFWAMKKLGGPDIAGRVNEAVQSGQEMTNRGREAQGSEGFDWTRLAGNVASPANLLGVKALAQPAATLTGRMGQAAGIGAGFGAATPVTDENYGQAKAGQIMAGGAIGGAIPLVGAGLSAGGNMVANAVNPSRRVANTLAEVAGDDTAAIAAALRRPQQALPGERITAAEAALPVQNPRFSALQQVAGELYDSPSMVRIAQGNQAARAAQLPSADLGIVGALRRTLEQERDAATRGIRTDALSQSNVAGQVLPGLERRAADRGAQAAGAVNDVRRFSGAAQRADEAAQNWYPVTGMPRAPGMYSRAAEQAQAAEARAGQEAGMSLQRGAERRFAEMQAQSVAQSGHYPLRADAIQRQISSVLKNPELGPSDLVSKAMGNLQEKIAKWTNENGVIDGRALYTIRKELGTSIKKFAKEESNFDQKLTAGLQNRMQDAIDDAIEAAGGTGWRDYLRMYSEKSRPIDQLDLGARLSQAMTSATGKERPAMLANTARNLSDDVAETFTATQQQRLADVLASQQRGIQNTELAQKGMPEVKRMLGELAEPPPVPGWFSPVVTAAKKGMSLATNKATEATMRRIANVMLNDPAEAARLMESAARQNTPQGKEIRNIIAALQAQGTQQTAGGIGR